jgi:hypothetical protein
MKTIAILAGLLFSTSVLSQQGDMNRDRDNDRRVHHRDHGTFTTVPRSYAPRAGAPDPYAPKVGAPDPYAPRAGAPDPYATRAGAPDPYATKAGDPNAGRIQPDTGGGARRR